MITGMQIIALIFALGIFYLSFLNYKRDEFNLMDFSLWVAICLGLILVSLFGDIFHFIAASFHYERTMDIIISMAFVILFGVVFLLYSEVRRMRRDMDRVIRQVALESVPKK